MCKPGISRLCCIVQYVSWCPYFMHCERNHVGPVTFDATTCFSVKCGCARLQHHAPPLLPSLPLLPSSLWGSGGWRGRGSRCAQYKSGSCIPCKRHHCHPAEGCVHCCTSPCASLCVLLCRVPRLPPYNTAPSPRTVSVPSKVCACLRMCVHEMSTRA